DLQRREQLGLEQFGAAAIMRQCGERPDHRLLAHVATAEISLEPPDRNQDLAWHPEFLFDASKQRRVPLQHGGPAIDAAGTDAGRDILLKTLVEGVALAAIEGERGRILREPREGLGDDRLRDAGGL